MKRRGSDDVGAGGGSTRAMRTAAREYDYGECRVMFGHRWARLGPVTGGKARNTWRVVAACDRCEMRRITVVLGSGAVASRTYKQPKDYHLTRDVDRATLRLATLQGWRKAA